MNYLMNDEEEFAFRGVVCCLATIAAIDTLAYSLQPIETQLCSLIALSHSHSPLKLPPELHFSLQA